MNMRLVRLLLLTCTALLTFASAAFAAPADVDTTFGAGGVVALPSTVGSSTLPTATQADGKVVIGYDRKADDVAELMRMNPDGTVDTSFGTGGKFELPQAGATSTYVASVIAQPSGRILVAGSATIGGTSQMILWAVTPSGALDTAFNGGTGYRVFAVLGTNGNNTVGAVVQPDGDIALVCGVTSGGIEGVALQFASSTGALGGSTIKTFPSDLNPTSVAMQPDGAVVVGAVIESGSIFFGATLRFTQPGGWDNAFGGSGITVLGIPVPIFSQVYSIETRGDGAIASIGHMGFAGTVQTLNPDGTPNTTHDSYGITRSAGPYSVSIFTDGVIVGGNRLLAAGVSTNFGAINSPFVARLDANGALDPTFASGVVSVVPEKINGVSAAVQADGHYLLFLQLSNTGELKVVRLMGDYVAPPVKTPLKIKFGTFKSSQKARKFRKMTGTASGTGLAKIEVAILKVDTALLKKSRKCAFVKSSSGARKNYSAVKGKCTPVKWLKGKGTTKWSYSLKKALPAGKYKLFVRASGAGGEKSSIARKSLTLKK